MNRGELDCAIAPVIGKLLDTIIDLDKPAALQVLLAVRNRAHSLSQALQEGWTNSPCERTTGGGRVSQGTNQPKEAPMTQKTQEEIDQLRKRIAAKITSLPSSTAQFFNYYRPMIESWGKHHYSTGLPLVEQFLDDLARLQGLPYNGFVGLPSQADRKATEEGSKPQE